MTNKKTTKQQLVASIVLLFMCFSMLLGTTFAWFTDSVTSAGNIIKTGTLDVEMYYADGTKAVPADDAWTSADGVAIYKADQLWEPGYTDAKHIKIENKGTLALKYQVAILPTGEVSDLAEVIDVYLYDGATQIADRTALDETKNVGTLADVIKTGIAKGDLDAKEAYTMTIVLKMQETAGNEYQDKSIGDDFTIQLLATQYTAENDSFDNQYDVNAPFSLWNGVVPTEMPATLVVDGATQTIHVKDAAAFAYLGTLSAKWAELYTDGNGREWSNYANGAGADYYYSGKWTVSLEADIDLGNHSIAPVDIKLGQSTGASAFNGNGHIIRNINATTGLFADGTRATFSNFTLENVKATRGALIGSARNGITNVTVKNATISGTDYVGGLVGSAYSNVTGCTVIDSSVVATGKEAGGMIGYVENSREEATVASNVVRNVSVYAGNRAAGLVAQVNVNVKVYNNTVDTVTVGAEDTRKYQPNAVVSNALDAKNVYDNTVINANVVNNVAIVKDVASFKAALTNGAEFINANGANLGSLNYGLKTTTVPAGKTVTISNAKFEGMSYGNAVDGTVVFENCTFTNTGAYSIHFDAGNGNVVFNNCTLEGWCSFGSAIQGVEMNDCTIKGNGTYGLVRFYQTAVLTNCVFDVSNVNAADGYFDGVDCGTTNTVKLVGCVNVNGRMEEISEANDGTIVIDGAQYVTSTEELTDAISSGNVTLTLAAGEYKMPSSGATGEVNISGTKDTVLDMTMGAYMENAAVTIEGVTIKTCTGKVNGNGSDYAALYTPNVTYKNCTFVGPMRVGRDGAKFINCTFTELGNDYIWTYGNDVTFEGCTFNTEGKAILIYSDGGNEIANVTVKNCVFNSTAGAKAGAIANQNCAAIEIHNYGNGVKLVTEGNTNDANFSGEWRIKTYETGKTKVFVNGTEYTTIAIDGKTMTIDANKNVTVND